MRRWLLALAALLLAVAMPQAQTAPKIAWAHAGTNVTHFQVQIAANWVIDVGMPTPSGGIYEYTLPALPSGSYDVAVTACYGATCETSATLKVSKGVVAGATANNFYWVSPTGAAVNWAACKSDAPLAGAAACTIAQANAGASAGDTVWFRTGTYTDADVNGYTIRPVRAGSSASSRITFKAAPGETPILEGTWAATPYLVGAYLDKDYIVLDGLTFKNKHNAVRMVGADYVEIAHCTIYATATYTDAWASVIPISVGYVGSGAQHNWIHDNTIHGFGANDAEGSDLIRVGGDGDTTPNHNTFNGNVLYHAGHSTAGDQGTHNVWLNNIAHNEGWKTDGFTDDLIYGTATGGSSGKMIDTGTNLVTAGVVAGMAIHTTGNPTSAASATGIVTSVSTTTNPNDTANFTMAAYWLPTFTTGTGYVFTPSTVTNAPDAPGHLPGDGKYGHRNFGLSNDSGTDVAKYVLMEGNRLGFASINYSNRGAEGLSLGSPGNIIRYNAIFGSDASGIGIKSYTGASHYGDNNRIYSNTFYKNGQAEVSAPNDFICAGISDLYSYANTYKNNLLFQNGTSACDTWGDFYGATGTFAANLCATTDAPTGCTATTDPGFVNTTMTNPMSTTLPDLSLTVGADAIGKGGALTTVHADDTGSGTTLVVTDALYFQDGTLGSSLSQSKVVWPDWVAVGTVGNVAAVSSINYATNTITLAAGITRSDGDNVWLYKRADGVRVLYDTAPDAGAYEYGAGAVVAPTGLVVR